MKRGWKLVDISLAKDGIPKKPTRNTRNRKQSPVPKGNERAVSYLLKSLEQELNNSDQEDDRVCATKKVGTISTLPSLRKKYKKCDTPLTDLQNIINTTSSLKKSTKQESNNVDTVSEKRLEAGVSQQDQEDDGICATKKVCKIRTLSSPLKDKNCDTPLPDLQNILNKTSPSKNSTEQELCNNVGDTVSEKGLEAGFSQQDKEDDDICATNKVGTISTLPSPRNIICNTPLTDLKNIINTTSSLLKNSAKQESNNVGDTVSEKGLEAGISQQDQEDDGICATKKVCKIRTLSSPLKDKSCDTPLPDFQNILNKTSPSKNSTQQELCSNVGDIVNKKGLEVVVSQQVSLAASMTITESKLNDGNMPSALNPQRYDIVEGIIIEEVIVLQSPDESITEKIKSNLEDNLPVDISCVVSADVVTDSQSTPNEPERDCHSKPTSPSLIEDALDLQSEVPCMSEINMEPIDDDLYPNLSIQSADIVVDSPCSSFNIPSPCSSVNSPVATNNKKRNCEKRKGPGKIRTTNIPGWNDVKNKVLKNLGKEYANRKGGIMEEKKMKPSCSSKCIKKCSEKIEKSEREHVFKCYWELGNHERQWDFISKFVSSHEPKRIKAKGPNRSRVLKYTLPKNSDNSTSITVCRTMFLNTLSISEKTVRTLFDKQRSVNENMHKVTDLRGRHRNRPKKLSDNILNSVKDHVNELAPVESHYCRKSSTKKYLDGQLSYKRLHLLYLEWFDEQIYGNKKASLRQYQDIVNSNFNIAFYTPKKDQCDKCHAYKNIKEPTEEQKTEHDIHLRYKTSARTQKETDKSEAEKCQDGEIVTACFDMQKILTCPFGNVGIFYYKRKLNLYNFTVYDMAQKTGYCYMWSEVNGKKGANEICSGLMLFMQSKIEGGTKEFKFWSDNCSGQNRNRIVFALYQYIVGKYNVESITHRFLEVGHTQNEGDSVHSVIEGASKNMTIYTPEQWFNLIRWAKTTGEPYRVKEMTINDINDYRVLLGGKCWTNNDDNEKVAWSKVKEIHVSKENINIIKYKYQLDEEYKVITTLKRKTRGKQNNGVVNNIKQANTSNLKISSDKYKDLTHLCEKKIIPEEFHSYFKSLPCDQLEGNRSNNSDDDESE